MPGMKMMTMIGLCTLGLSATLTACDDDAVEVEVDGEAIERDMEEAGRDLRAGAREVGQEVEQGAEAVGREVDEAAHEVHEEVHD